MQNEHYSGSVSLFPICVVTGAENSMHGRDDKSEVSFLCYLEPPVSLQVYEPQIPSRPPVMTTFMTRSDFFATVDRFQWAEDDVTLWEQPAYKCLEVGQCLLTLICGSEDQVR